MKKIIDRIVLGSGSPNKNDLWIDDKDGLSLKVYDDGKWKSIAGGGSDGGGSSEITLGQAYAKAFRLDKKIVRNESDYTWVYTDETIPLPDLAMSLSGDSYIMMQYFDSTKHLSDYDITVPSGSVNYDDAVYEHTSEVSDSNCIIVPFNELDEQHLLYDEYDAAGSVYFLYSIDKLSDSFDGGYRAIRHAGNPGDYFGINANKCLYFVKYNGQLYFFNEYEGD